jgi:integrase
MVEKILCYKITISTKNTHKNIQLKIIPRNLNRHIQILSCLRARSNYIPYDLMLKMFEAVPQLKIRKWQDIDVIMMFKIAYWCELRPNEYIGRKVEDFDIERSEVYLGKTKTGKEEYAVIPPPFRQELVGYLRGRTGILLPGLTYNTVYYWLIRLGKMLDLPALTTSQAETGEKTKGHIFRKSLPKDLIFGVHGRKAPLNVISKGLRHKGKNALSSTQEYLKLSNEDVKAWWEDSSQEVISDPKNIDIF